MTASPLPADFTSDETWLAQAIDPHARLARLVRMDAASYRASSFLDDRMIQPDIEARLCDLEELVAASAAVKAPPAGWIFHIGHVGSTLLSRLLGEMDGALSIREPRSLRDLAAAAGPQRPPLAKALSRLMARSGSGARPIIKATSFVSEYAPLLVEPGAPALFLYASPRNYVAGILAGENSVKELHALHETRLERLVAKGIDLSGFQASDAHRAAAAWACEMTSLEAAAEAMPERKILWADFDAMLANMANWLSRVAAHFDIPVTPQRIDELAVGPLMRRYSKALEHDYSPSLRADLLAEATRNHLPGIDAAVAALREAAKSVPMLARSLARVHQES